MVALGVPFWASGLCFALCAFVTTTILQEFVRGARVRQRATGTDLFTALVGLFARSRRRYGGYIVHVGIVLVFLGFAGGGFERRRRRCSSPGSRSTSGRTPSRYHALTVTDDAQKQMVTAEVERVERRRSRWAACIRRGGFSAAAKTSRPPRSRCGAAFAEDLYVVLAGFDVETQEANLQVKVNPLVNWIWFGVGHHGRSAR